MTLLVRVSTVLVGLLLVFGSSEPGNAPRVLADYDEDTYTYGNTWMSDYGSECRIADKIDSYCKRKVWSDTKIKVPWYPNGVFVYQYPVVYRWVIQGPSCDKHDTGFVWSDQGPRLEEASGDAVRTDGQFQYSASVSGCGGSVDRKACVIGWAAHLHNHDPYAIYYTSDGYTGSGSPGSCPQS